MRRHPVRNVIGAAVAVAAVVALVPSTSTGATDDPIPPTGGGSAVDAGHDPADDVDQAIADSADGTARVIVTTRLEVEPEAGLADAAVAGQRAAIDESLAGLDDTLAGTGSAVVGELETIPAAVATIDEAGLAALRADPTVATVTLDQEMGLALDVSTGIINSDLLNAFGVTGDIWEGGGRGRYEVAVVDTGVDRQHRAFTGRIVAEACFSATNECPNGTDRQVGPGAGDNCTFSLQCDHGTHVAGIAAGARFTGGHEGVAPGAGIVAIAVGHSDTACSSGEPNPCWRFFFSDLDRGLERVLSLRRGGRRIASINISLGGGGFTNEPACAAAAPTTRQITDNLLAAGVAVVAASGNNGFSNGISYPACLPSVYAVGATDDHDVPAFFSNVSSDLNWYAPGVDIVAPVPGGPFTTGAKSGTSMATPHVAGAFALLRECIGNSGPRAVATDLSATGRRITEFGVTRKRIDVLAAATRNVPNDAFASPRAIPARGGNLAAFNVCASRQRDEPGAAAVQNSVWFTWRAPRNGLATISTNDAGTSTTTFDTEMWVYTGSRLTALHLVDYDNNGGIGLNSRSQIRVRAGGLYRIRIDGVNAQNGRFNMRVVAP